MIVRPHPHWFRMLFLVRGSVLPKLWPRLVLIFGISLLALFAHRIWFQTGRLELNPQPFTLLGLALAIFLGFRTNVSYERYWEGRKLWGGALNATRSLARQALSLTRWPRDSTEARRFVLALADWLREARERGELSEILSGPIEANLNALSEIVGGCERLHGTPIPLTFSVMVHRVVYFYCTLLPLALAPSIGGYTPAFAVFVAYTFMALEAIAEELETPFGTDPNDLPLVALSEMIESTLRELLGEAVPAPAPVPEDYIVL